MPSRFWRVLTMMYYILHPSNSECSTPSSGPFRIYLCNQYGTGVYPSFRKLECVFPRTRGRKQIQFLEHILKFLQCQTMEKVQKPSNSECYTPSSEPFRICLYNWYEPGTYHSFRKSECVFPFTWGRKQIQFLKRCVLKFLECRTMGRAQKTQ
jgi:hypothetical protein